MTMIDDRRIDRPRPGYFRRRAYSKGPWQPAIVWEEPARDPVTRAAIDRAPVLRCVINGEEVEIEDAWPGLHPISEDEYKAMVELQLDPTAVPDFGQGSGHNSRDAELNAAASLALATTERDDAWFRKTALLVKQITAIERECRDACDVATAPHKMAIEQLLMEMASEAAHAKPDLRYALKCYADQHSIPTCPESMPHWRAMPPLVEVADATIVPREFCVPDMNAIKRAVARGEVVPGVTVKQQRQLVVV